MRTPLVSIIVPTKNSASTIDRCLKSCLNQTYTNIETIVVDNNSTDTTKKIAKKYTKQVFTNGPERSAQRNFGVSKAKGEFFFFVDSDMELSKDVVKECVQNILQKNKKKEIGGVIVPEVSIGKSFWEKVKAFERSFYNENGDLSTDAARFFPKDVFEDSGGYDEKLTGPEDWDLPERISKNYSIGRVKSVIYHYENIPSLWSLLKKKYYYALKAHLYLKKQNLSVASPKTLYFLRPVFYQQPQKYLKHPIYSLAMFAMLTGELVAGGLGFMKGKFQHL